MIQRISIHIWDFRCVYLVYLWPGYLTDMKRLSWTMPHTLTNCLLGYWDGIQHIWYQGSKSCLIYFAGVVTKMHCPALVNQSKAIQWTLVLISKNIIHGTKAAFLVTKTYSNQDKDTIAFLSLVGQISSNVQSLVSWSDMPFPAYFFVIQDFNGFIYFSVISTNINQSALTQNWCSPGCSKTPFLLINSLTD